MRFSTATLDEIRAALPVSAVVGRRVKLRCQGREYVGLSPFKAEKTPSFTVNDGFALGRKSWLFAGSDRGADRAAAVTTLIMTAKLNDIDPLAWLADVLARIADLPQSRPPELLPWQWKTLSQQQAA